MLLIYDFIEQIMLGIGHLLNQMKKIIKLQIGLLFVKNAV